MLVAAAAVPLAISMLAGLGASASAASSPHAAAAASTGTTLGVASGKTGLEVGNPFCKNLASKTILASSAANMFCLGYTVGAGGNTGSNTGASQGSQAVSGTPANVNAASIHEDVSPNGTRAYGQSETSIAASGRYVVEAWNDATTFFSTCSASRFRAEATGVGFSANGGRTFKDLGGLRNPNCKTTHFVYEGDPSVVAYRTNGQTWFYIASLYDSTTGVGTSAVALDACRAMGRGTSAQLRCGDPVIAARSKQCVKFGSSGGGSNFEFCSFLDKDFIAIDPFRHRIYVSYTEFPILTLGTLEEMSACSIRDARHPVCEAGSKLKVVQQPTSGNGYTEVLKGRPYFHIAGPGYHGCEEEGTYPAVYNRTGAVYVGFEYNLGTNLGYPPCEGYKEHTRDVITVTHLHCLPLRSVSPCAKAQRVAAVRVYSMTAAFIPGFNRLPTDWPRVAVSPHYRTVSMVWNDTRYHGNGDILMESFTLGSLRRVQRYPVVLDRPHHGGLTFMPAVKVADSRGRLDVAWFSRANAQTAWTNVVAALGVNPRTTVTPANTRITNVATNWLTDNSDIVPNFGDYMDTAISATGTPPFTGHKFYVAWADGRLGFPQPFEAHRRLR